MTIEEIRGKIRRTPLLERIKVSVENVKHPMSARQKLYVITTLQDAAKEIIDTLGEKQL